MKAYIVLMFFGSDKLQSKPILILDNQKPDEIPVHPPHQKPVLPQLPQLVAHPKKPITSQPLVKHIPHINSTIPIHRPRCPCDQVFSRCGAACPSECGSLRKPLPCTLQCKPGCICRDYLVLNDDHSACIPPHRCPACGRNEEFRPIGKHCVVTCDCLERCHSVEKDPGCYCKSGFVRDKNGACVPPHLCTF